jgi:hypothetical protein
MFIKKISTKEQKPFINLVTKIITQKQQGVDTKVNEKLIDKMFYELYNLTIEEIELLEK